MLLRSLWSPGSGSVLHRLSRKPSLLLLLLLAGLLLGPPVGDLRCLQGTALFSAVSSLLLLVVRSLFLLIELLMLALLLRRPLG